MEHSLILSPSGWRCVFAESGNENDDDAHIGGKNAIMVLCVATAFAEYIIEQTGIENPVVICARDARPTGKEIANIFIRTLLAKNIIVRYAGVSASPETFSFAKKFDGFAYISASHNPIAHNGFKFGLNSGGVLDENENAKLVSIFQKKIADENFLRDAKRLITIPSKLDMQYLFNDALACKKESLTNYEKFISFVISGTNDKNAQSAFFEKIKSTAPITIVCDMNGSARASSIDESFFKSRGFSFFAINKKNIAHGIIPEGENLLPLANEIERLHETQKNQTIIGYMPDCDGDRGNIVFWNEKKGKAVPLSAQEVFALSVASELAFDFFVHQTNENFKLAVVTNGATSMRIEEIAKAFGAEVFRAETGESHVALRAELARKNSFSVRIAGEGSNGGNITYPSLVRDPLATIFAAIKFLCIPELYKLWCEKTHTQFKTPYSLADILESLPQFFTSETSEDSARVSIQSNNEAELKKQFQTIFENEWNEKKNALLEKFEIASYEARITKNTDEIKNVRDFSLSANCGLRIIFYDEKKNPCAFFWMRQSKTERIFRLLADAKTEKLKNYLLDWERKMILKADKHTV